MALSPNSLAFIALSNEYCHAVENIDNMSMSDFISSMVKFLPRIYIAATDLQSDFDEEDEVGVEQYLEEDYYESLRRRIENMLGQDDVYLEVFEDDMKYSDTPIGMSLAEGLCDIFQVLYNFIATVKDAPDYTVNAAIAAVKADFNEYWSRILCNVMRPLNNLYHNTSDDDAYGE